MTSILVSSVGRRGYVVDHLKYLLPDIPIIGIDSDVYASGLDACDFRVVCPPYSSPEYAPFS